MQIDQSPARRDFVRGDQPGRNCEIAEVGGSRPADVLKTAALMQRVLKFFEFPAQFLVGGVPA